MRLEGLLEMRLEMARFYNSIATKGLSLQKMNAGAWDSLTWRKFGFPLTENTHLICQKLSVTVRGVFCNFC